MARTLTQKDAHLLMAELVKQATGQKNIAIVSTADFVSAGETVMATGVENVLNSLSLIIGRTLMAVRPYKAKLMIINALNTGAYTHRIRKISYYSKLPHASGDWNTDLNTNFNMGYDNGTNSGNSTHNMWEQNAPVVMEMNFAGSSVWEDSVTIYEYQLKQAFENESNFGSFVAGIMTEKGNDIESQKEAFNRMTLLNYLAGVYDLSASNGSVINLTTAFNQKYGTSYTSAQLRTTYFAEFLAFFISTFKQISDMLENRSAKYHWSPAKQVNGVDYVLLRHTPKAKQKAILYKPFFIDAESQVLPQVFNDEYLKMANYEGVMYWQDEKDPAQIKVTPAIPNVQTGVQTTGDAVELDYVLGAIFDEDAVMVDYQIESAETTPLEARKRYRNIWYSFSKNAINDFTENCVLFIMKDED